jgi:septum formation protein
MRIILASKSPARKKLLREIISEFECHESGYKEDMSVYKQPSRLSKFLALQKAKYIAHHYPDSVIIGADTFVTIGRQKIGKPKNLTEAREIFKKKSGRDVYVHSGLAIIKTDADGKTAKELLEHVVTKLTFSKITDSDINFIFKHDNVLETAGGLTIEGVSGKFIKKISGDYNNVIGLPINHLEQMLKKI